MTEPRYPNFMQMRPGLPRTAWDALRAVSFAAALLLCVALVVWPRVALFAWWGITIALLPLLFFLAPGLWRNVCPLATSNQLPRRLCFQRASSLPPVVRSYGFLVPIVAFLALVPARKVIFNTNGTALAILLLATGAAAFVGGVAFKGKSGWCSSFCPLLPVQRVYGQTPFVVVRNSHCEPCVGCVKNCYDFNPHVAQLADLHDPDPYRGAYRKVFAGAFTGLVLAYFTAGAASGSDVAATYAWFGVYILGGIGAFFALDAVVRVSAAALAVVFGAAALDIYYWFTWPQLAQRVGGSAPWWFVWPARSVVFALSALWVVRTILKERRFLAQVDEPEAAHVDAAAASVLEAAVAGGRPEVTVLPDERRIAVVAGATLLDVVERDGLAIEAGCRMGMCGSDPVCVVGGGENLSPVGAEERATLDRLGLAATTRLACSARVSGPVAITLTPERADASDVAADVADADPSVRRVVVIGNGIAGVTAADYVRRRHGTCEIDLVARERYHLYNRMAITRLIYGRSAMQNLFLMQEQWYDDHRITTWLNTRVVAIDRAQRVVRLGTGESLPYDRLILTTGSSNFVPPVDGFGQPGTFVLREAEDAMQIRSFVQEHVCRRAVIAGGGLLGLEAAYALRKLGLHVVVLDRNDRLLHRQLDERAGALLLHYLEGLGIDVLLGASAARVEGEELRVDGVVLDDGTRVACDVFLVSAGIAPNVDLAREADLDVGRGVVVDAGMRTSDPDIFAAGDLAQVDGVVGGLWPAAVEQAQVAAANAVGGDARYASAPPVTMLKVPGVDLMSLGRFEAGPGEEAIVLEDAGELRYRKLVVAGGRIVGGILLGHPLDGPAVVRAVQEGADVSGVLGRLRAGDWGVLAASAKAA